MAELVCHGAAGEVTGSMHMVQVDGQWVALDCGMYHGRRSETEEKNRSWPVPPAEIAAVVVSHAHIDHTGRLPRLIRDGFEGTIFCTPATRDLCAIMLADSAHIQEEDVRYVNKKRARKGLEPVEPLYDYKDAMGAVRAMVTVVHDRWFPVVPGLLARFNEAGHMLGSVGIELALGKREGRTPSLYYTGDVGRKDKPIIRDPAPFPACETIICESTYGDRFHEPVNDAREVFVETIKRTYERKGKVIVPSFSVGRTQTLVYFLHEAIVAGELPRIPVFIDSPLSVNATQVFRMHPECYDAEARALGSVTSDILGGSHVTYIEDVEESKALNRRRNPCIIISASGMCEFGRIRHHIKNNVTKAKNTILIPGFQAAHTLGRRLVEGAEKITLFHEEYPVRAEVVQLHGFSGHADQNELAESLLAIKPHVKRVVLVHGEEEQSIGLEARLRREGFTDVTIARGGMRFDL